MYLPLVKEFLSHNFYLNSKTSPFRIAMIVVGSLIGLCALGAAISVPILLTSETASTSTTGKQYKELLS
jgi:hypothetical protein